MEEVIENESELTLKNSDQYFIQNNYQNMTLEQLAHNTQLPPEDILAYIEEYEAYLKSNGINTVKKFNFTMGLSPEGTVSFGLEWPDIQSLEALLPNVGKFFFLLNAGKLKPSMVQFLAKYADDQQAHTIVRRIMQDWSQQEKLTRETPIVEPNEVFKD